MPTTGLPDFRPAAAATAGVREQFRRLAGVVPVSGTALLAVWFLLLGLFGVALLTLLVPPFRNADEPAHFLRAYQVSQGGLIGDRTGPKDAGGLIDAGLVHAMTPLLKSPATNEAEATPAMRRDAAAAVWTGQEIEAPFPGTAGSSPLFYLPAAAAIWAGKLAHLTVLTTLLLARALTGVVAVLIGTAAIACAGGAAPWLFALLCLPATLGQIASPSQDSLTIVLAAAAAATAGTALREGAGPSLLAFWGMVAALAVLAQAHPPYAALALVLLVLPRPGWRQRLAGLGTVLAAGLAWGGFAAVRAQAGFPADIPPGALTDAPGQLHLLLNDPGRVADLLENTIRSGGLNVWNGVIGQFGGEDALFPPTYYQIASAMLVPALLLCLRGQVVGARPPAGRLLAALTVPVAMALSVLAILGIQYVIHAPPGLDVIEGIEGRHFLPVLVFLAAALPLLWPPGRLSGVWTVLFVVVAVFPLVSLVVTLRAILLRFFA